MSTAGLHFDVTGLAWRALWQTLRSPAKVHENCVHRQGIWHRVLRREPGVMLDGTRYCLDQCLEQALTEALGRTDSRSSRTRVAHRVPLGLLLVSRRQLTPEQLRAALEAQRRAGHGRLGDWLQSLGFAGEEQITAALARQWSCPVLRIPSSYPRSARLPQIPFSLLENANLVPVDYSEATRTLHVAFGEGIDYNVLYALEKMIGCHTEACMAVPSFIRVSLQALTHQRGEHESSFAALTEGPELVRILRSYCIRVSATEIRLAACGGLLWVRLVRLARPPLDLVFRSPQAASATAS